MMFYTLLYETQLVLTAVAVAVVPIVNGRCHF